MSEWIEKNEKKINVILIFILILYAFRHIADGIDYNDTGYSLANFRYMGLEHMDSMWLYATYLANVTGHFFTLLPFGKTLIGMNFYTGLFAAGTAAAGYLFCKRKLEIPMGIAFAGEFLALGLCWCPTADLYNYMTYTLLSACVFLLYCGLTSDRGDRIKNRLLFTAGVCLGANLFVRFANAPEIIFIFAVWGYGVLEALQEKKNGSLQRTLKRTFVCASGYLTSLIAGFLWIQIRYGLNDYVAGIRRLFAMTDNATDYKAKAMLMAMFTEYFRELYYVIRVSVIIAAAMVLYHVIRAAGGKGNGKRKKAADFLAVLSSIFISAVMIAWLYRKAGFASFYYSAYDSILRPAVLFLLAALATAGIRIFLPKVPVQEKLIGGLVILIIVVTPLGSNNGVYPIINNLFLAAPYLLWQMWKFAGFSFESSKYGIIRKVSLFPVKSVFLALLFLLFVQVVLFGHFFVFAESTGAQGITERMTREGALKGVKMNPERAALMTQMMDFTEERGLVGTDVIFYGDIPALSFYLQMPAAFNPWPNLTSYSVETFEKDLTHTDARMAEDGSYRPVVMLERRYAECLEKIMDQGTEIREVKTETILELMMGKAAADAQPKDITAAEKFRILLIFMEEYGYRPSLKNAKLTVFET